MTALNLNKCQRCGYSKSASALVFHHKDESTKEFCISGNNLHTKAWNTLVAEARKCALVCANCHAEIRDEEGWVHEDGRKTCSDDGI